MPASSAWVEEIVERDLRQDPRFSRMLKPKFTALLLSLFVLPGLGHIYLGKKKEGCVIMGLVIGIILILALFFIQEYKTQIHTVSFSDSFLTILWEGIKKTWETTQTICLLGLEAFGIIWLAAALDLFRR